MIKKKHHFISKAYLQAFCDGEGKLHVHRKDDPEKVLRLSPDNVGFHKYYYSQPLPEGGHDHNQLEDFFCEYESRWPGIVKQLRAWEKVNDHLGDIYAFIALQHARVPATRDMCEKLAAEFVKGTMRQMDAEGKLPPRPEGFEDILDHVDVTIDPQQSILAMVHIMFGIGDLLNRIGIAVLRNKTPIPFLTSDNPVIWFDRSLPTREMMPYRIREDGPITFLFPVAPDLIIFGDSAGQNQFARDGLSCCDLKDIKKVKMMNWHICRFAYETVFSDRAGFKELVKQHADVSPVLRTETIPASSGQFLLFQYVWGQRTLKPKWKPKDQ